MRVVDRIGAEDSSQSSRAPKEIDIVLSGRNAEGQAFVERTKTLFLSEHAAAVLSTHRLAAEQQLTIVHVASNVEAEIRVIGQLTSAPGSHGYAVAFLDPSVDFWSRERSPEMRAESLAGSATLGCSICGHREVIAAGSLEFAIWASDGAVLRACRSCNHTTAWKEVPRESSGRSTPPEAPPVAPGVVAAAEKNPSTTLTKNRRAHPRKTVNCWSFLRSRDSEDSVVFCENVSPRGLFRSTKRYDDAACIEVAVPHSAGGPCKLVPAEVVYVQKLPELGMLRCGVRYLANRAGAPVRKPSSTVKKLADSGRKFPER